jgi:hypothetical protein
LRDKIGLCLVVNRDASALVFIQNLPLIPSRINLTSRTVQW